MSKALTSRLQPLIPFLVHPDQTSFIKGRSISENFIYAAEAELTQTCYKRRVPTVALKLDFRKAFDSIEWQALDTILEAKNFAPRWRQWVQDILNPSQTAVLLNGTPGKWINCMKGLRQGDPLSPHLFILVADVLQQLIITASANGIFEHPISTKELLTHLLINCGHFCGRERINAMGANAKLLGMMFASQRTKGGWVSRI